MKRTSPDSNKLSLRFALTFVPVALLLAACAGPATSFPGEPTGGSPTPTEPLACGSGLTPGAEACSPFLLAQTPTAATPSAAPSTPSPWTSEPATPSAVCSTPPELATLAWTPCPPSSPAPTGGFLTVAPPEGRQPPAAVIAAARAFLAQQLAIDVLEVQFVSAEDVQWPDTSLGCPQPGMAYAQIVTPGYKFELGALGRLYAVHGNASGSSFVLCDQP